MTNEQAIERLIAIKNIIYGDDLKALDLATQALEKQMPKKKTYHLGGTMNYWSCPNCGRIYWDLDYLSQYCHSCGQKLEKE